ncbi:MAG TPA: acetate--CoA ligase family protein [Longimicrobiales bacterium]|nr:acetate--CoA ligase family protein [Longimicrobiales bacterium]
MLASSALYVALGTANDPSDVGGVALDIRSEAEVRGAYYEMVAQVRERVPNAPINGVVVEPFVRGGRETIIGMSQDPSFGPVIMFGLAFVLSLSTSARSPTRHSHASVRCATLPRLMCASGEYFVAPGSLPYVGHSTRCACAAGTCTTLADASTSRAKTTTVRMR